MAVDGTVPVTCRCPRIAGHTDIDLPGEHNFAVAEGFEASVLTIGENMNLNQMFYHWQQVRSDLLETIDKFSEPELTFEPFQTSFSAGQIMLHIAGAEEGWFRYVIGREYDEWPPEYSLADYPTLESIKGLLSAVHVHTDAYLESQSLADLDRLMDVPWGESIPQSWIIWHVLEHEIHHRGELSLILGLLGREGLDV